MNIRKDFPILEEITYLDTGAGSLKPIQVIDAMTEFYRDYPINPHSQDSALGNKVYSMVDESRGLVAELVGASKNEVIFTSGTTESINMFARMSRDFLKEGDEILVSMYNHVSNLDPWVAAAKLTGAKVVYSIDLIKDVNPKTKIVAFSQQNNTVAQHIDIEKLYKEVKKVGAILLNDAAQAIVHEDVSLHDSDIIVFSANKLYGPTGTGCLIIRKELLEFLNVKKFGGGSIRKFGKDERSYKKGPTGHEAGTPNTAGIIGLGAAIKYFNALEDVHEYEKELVEYTHDQLAAIEGIEIYSRRGDMNIMFNYMPHNAQDVVSYLGNKGILLRAGEHCAKLLCEVIDKKSSIRLSIAAYNNKEDIDKAIKAITDAKGNFVDYV